MHCFLSALTFPRTVSVLVAMFTHGLVLGIHHAQSSIFLPPFKETAKMIFVVSIASFISFHNFPLPVSVHIISFPFLSNTIHDPFTIQLLLRDAF